MMLPKSNFREMSLQELRHYVLVHRGDEQAGEEFTSRERPNAIYFENMPLSEQEAMLRELLDKKTTS